MGIATKSYMIFDAFLSKKPTRETTDLRQKLSGYKLFSFILYDSLKNSDFAKCVAEDFPKLDEIARGKDFMFFVLADPPDNLIKNYNSREHSKIVEDYQNEEFRNPENAIKTGDERAFLYNVLELIGIPEQDLPCIVTTKDFKAFDYQKTNPKELEQQIKDLVKLAKNKPIQSDNYSDIFSLSAVNESRGFLYMPKKEDDKALNIKKRDMLLYTIQPLDGDLNTTINEKIEELKVYKATLIEENAKLMENIEKNEANLLEMEKQKNNLGKQKKKKIVINRSMNYEKERIENNLIMIAKNEFTENIIDDYCCTINYIVYKNYKVDLNQLLPKNTGLLFLSDQSLVVLKAAYAAYSYYEVRKDITDYSTVVIGLSKVFEREIDDSAGHWIRRNFAKVKLPDSFNVRQIDLDDREYLVGKRKVFFNRGKKPAKKIWLPPTMGDMCNVFEEMYNENNYAGALVEIKWDRERTNTVIEKWREIADIRNDAAHYEIVSREMFLKLEKIFFELTDLRFFEALNLMRKMYSENIADS